jgi:hypothetical protein
VHLRYPTALADRVPRLAHFVFGLRPQDEPFHLVHYLAIRSCLEVVRPDEVFVHCHELPYGIYWDLIRPHVTLHRVTRAAEVDAVDYHPTVRPYVYAHHADFVRLDVLAEWGGLYADIDTLFLAPPPDACWTAAATLGLEADVVDERTGRRRPSASNALLLAEPGARFVREWRSQMVDALDGSWSAHSCFLGHDLARAMADHVHVEPQRTFHAFAPTPDGLRALLETGVDDVAGISSVHLMAHLWWDDARRDFSRLHAQAIDPRWIETTDSTYAVAARRFLPDLAVLGPPFTD